MRNESIISTLSNGISYRSKGLINAQYPIKRELKHLATPTIHNYTNLPLSAQQAVLLSKSIRGKLGVKSGKKGGFVFQMSNGTQQIKLYDPKIYEKNAQNTPLRKRSRQIMQLKSLETTF